MAGQPVAGRTRSFETESLAAPGGLESGRSRGNTAPGKTGLLRTGDAGGAPGLPSDSQHVTHPASQRPPARGVSLKGPGAPALRLPYFLVFGLDQRHIDKVLADEPQLQLIAAQDIAYNQVVGPVITELRSPARQLPALADDDLMGIHQP